jgi:hydrogenase maturation factor HypF (carbamoyltransferase family)
VYFVFQLEFSSNKRYISTLIDAYAKQVGIEIEVYQNEKVITLLAKQDDKKLESFLVGLEEILPASIYLGKSQHAFVEEKPELPLVKKVQIPHSIAPCPTCQKEMFDVASSRYYYPFTSCNHCGSQHPFLDKYPFNRANSSMKFLVPCESCKQEQKQNALRRDYPLISCIECGITVKMVDKKSERYANDKGSYRKLFEVSAKAISRGKTVLVKTLNGYRKFFKPFGAKASDSKQEILMMTSANAINSHLMMVPQEFNALLSIERPILRVSTKSDGLKAIYGSSSLVKYPDEGMTILLARELLNLGLEYVAYEEVDALAEVDFLVDFDIPITFQKDTRLFINQDTKFFISGERIVFPMELEREFPTISLAHELMAVNIEGRTIIDNMDRFQKITGSGVNILESEEFESGHENERTFEQWRGSMLSVLAEHQHIGQKSIGIHFDKSLYFLYYNGKEVINVVPPNPFEADSMFEYIAKLREGSDRLVANYKKHFPEITKRLEELSGESDIFTVTAIMLELKEESFEGISSKALEFMGKGGIQIDTHVQDNRFDNYAFLASVMSYKIAGVEASLMCYSIFESFGDYVSEIVSQLITKTKVDTITFTGETFANQALFARIERHMGMRKLLFPKNLPIGKECGVYGGLFL